MVITNVPPSLEYGEDDHAVKLRFDAAKPQRQRWSASEDRKAMFASKPRELHAQLLKADRLLFEFTPIGSVPEVVSFDVRGLAEHAEALRPCLGKR